MTSSTNPVGDPRLFSAQEIEPQIDVFLRDLYSSSSPLSNRHAAVFRALLPTQLRALQQSQRRHLKFLLDPVLDEAVWQKEAGALGRQLAQLRIPADWMTESSRLFGQHIAVRAETPRLSAEERSSLLLLLADRLLRDLALQLAAYIDPVEAIEQLRELPSQIDHLLLTAPTDAVLYSRVTEFLTQIPGIEGAWFGRPDEQQIVHPHALAGKHMAEYLQGAPIHLLDNLDSPLARAWITGEPQFIADWAEKREIHPQPFWQQRGLRFGWRSSCAIPVACGSLRDTLLLYSSQVNFFAQPEIRQLVAHLQGVLGVTLERLRVTEALKEQQQNLVLYKAAFDASRNGILIADAAEPGQPIRYVNSAFERITGYSAEEALGRSLRFMEAPCEAETGLGPQHAIVDPQLAILSDALQKGEPCAIEVKNFRKDGTQFWNSLNIAPVRDSSGLISSFIAVQNDITRLKNTIAQNASANTLYRALMSAAELIIRAQNERELLDQLCRLLVEGELFSQAWIARPNIAGDLEIQSIFSTLSLKQARFLPNVYTGDEERILAVRAWRQAKLQYTNDRLADPHCPEIQDFYRQHNLRATAVIPLYRDGDLWALLTLLSHQTGIFTPELLDLLERIGRLAGHGLDAIDLRSILEEEREHQSWLARHDALTDILNRRGIIERMEEAVSRARRHEKILAVAVMDLDGFKAINDLHGHPAGDLLLRTIAERLQSSLRQTDAVGRLGSDEFVLILEDLDDEDGLALMLGRVQEAVLAPVHLSNGRTVSVRGSIGVTLFPRDESAPDRLLRHAERALYTLKESEEEPAERWAIFQAEADERKYVRQKTILSLFRGGNLRIHYQPVVDLQTGRVSGIEALARLADQDSSLLAPAEFIPRLSTADLVTLTHQVVAQSIQDLQRLDKAGYRLNAGINLEPITLADPKAVEDLCRQIGASGIDPDRFVFELLERADTLTVAGSKQALRDLKSCGVRIALDDVGSAYSSLLRVKELPVDMIKLDRSFLIGLEQQPKELRFLLNLVHLAQALGLAFVAEGIECAASGDALAALGVRLAQGYAIARPMSVEDLLHWLKRYKAEPWQRPTSVLGAVALQLRDLDASGRILEQRPAFLEHLLARAPDWEHGMQSGISAADAGILRLAAAHRSWNKAMAELSSRPGGLKDFQNFQTARAAYEEQLFQAALEDLPGLNANL